VDAADFGEAGRSKSDSLRTRSDLVR